MAQKNIQVQSQTQTQQQRLSQQHLLQVKLLEMPLMEMEEAVDMELDDNPALESESPDDALANDHDDVIETSDGDDYEEINEREERESALDDALESIGRDDEMPESYGPSSQDSADYEEMVYGDTTSFYDKLNEQIGELDLTDTQRDVMEYLIGSLDEDGLLRKELDTISDELAIYYNIEVSEGEIENILKLLQGFDPAGLGGRSLQECLLLQIDRKPEGRLKQAMKTLVTDHYDEFIKKHWDKIQVLMELTDLQTETLRDEILRLNPKPGASLGETQGRNVEQITPDFIVDTADDGSITFSLNRGNIPDLKVSQSFVDMVDTYRNNKEGMSRQNKEALLYAKEKVEKAQGFIDAVKQRRRTLYLTMKTIIEWQRKFFQDGDEADLKPMILKDIAEKTGFDISTISRVSNMKYAQTKWGTFRLKFFFSDGYTTGNGEELSTRKIKIALKELVESEDKKRPLSDDVIKDEMAKRGFPIARRTVAKYREQLGIPVARMRKR